MEKKTPSEPHTSSPLTPLELDGWLEFNAWRTRLRPRRIVSAAADGPQLRAVLYLDRRGRVRLPAGNPYLAVSFLSARSRPSGRTEEWLKAAATLVEEMERRGVPRPVGMSGDIDDVRPWRWRGFRIGVRYTYWLDFPVDAAVIDRLAKRQCARAAELGMTVERVRDVAMIATCLRGSEVRRGFSYEIGVRELTVAQHLLGDDSLRMYVCVDSGGRPASASVVLHSPGARAVDWLAGTATSSLADGSSSLVRRYVFDDLAAAGSIGIDFCGANIESVAAFKSRWGSRLRPFYNVRTRLVSHRAALWAADLRSEALERYARVRGAD